MKKQKDRKYQKSDQRICDFGNEIMRKEARKIDIKNVEIYRGARVSRATFSRHYRSVTEIKIREEEEVFRKFCNEAKSSDNKEMVILKFVLLIYRNREIFRVLIKRNDIFLLRRLVSRVNKLTMRRWRSYGTAVDRQINRICIYFVMAIVEEWARRGFRGDLLEEEVLKISVIYDFLEKNQGELAQIFMRQGINTLGKKVK